VIGNFLTVNTGFIFCGDGDTKSGTHKKGKIFGVEGYNSKHMPAFYLIMLQQATGNYMM